MQHPCAHSWYYRYDEVHLAACTSNVHAMLHITKYIRLCGPAWTTWAFPMERFCGKLSARITSRLHPYATLSNFVKRSAQVSQLKACYMQVWDHLSKVSMRNALSAREVVYPECKYSYFPPSWLKIVCNQIRTPSYGHLGHVGIVSHPMYAVNWHNILLKSMAAAGHRWSR